MRSDSGTDSAAGTGCWARLVMFARYGERNLRSLSAIAIADVFVLGLMLMDVGLRYRHGRLLSVEAGSGKLRLRCRCCLTEEGSGLVLARLLRGVELS
jgi:hypothetical protein